MIETKGLAREAMDSNCCTMKVLPPPLFAMIRTFASLSDGSNGENGMSCLYGVFSKNSGDLGVPCHGPSTGRRSAALVVSMSCSRLSMSASPGNELKNRHLFAKVSVIALAPFIL